MRPEEGEKEDPSRRTAHDVLGRRRSPAAGGGELAGIGFQLAATVFVFLFTGRWLDGRFGTAPWLTMICVFVGAAAGFYSMYRKLMAAQKRARDEKTGRPS